MLDFKKHISDFILKSGFVGCLVIDRNANMLYTNEVFDNLMRGIKGSVQGMNLIDVLREEEQAAVREVVESLFEQGSIPKTEWAIINTLDEQLYLDFEGSLIEENGEQFGLGIVIDKTRERTLKQELIQKNVELEYTNAQRELAIKTGKLGIWKLNLKTNINIWNDELLDIYELTRKEWEADLEGWQKMVFEEDMDLANQELAKAFAGEYVFDVRFRIKTKSGKIKHIYASAGPFFDEKGNIIEVHGVNIDITNLVENEQYVTDKKKQIENVTNNIPGVVLRYVFHHDGTESIVFINDVLKDVFELDTNEVHEDATLIFATFNEEDRIEVRNDLLESNKTLEPLESYFTITTKSGIEKRLHAKGTPRKNQNNDIVWDTIIFDITEIVEAESEARIREQYFENITNQLPGLVVQYYINADGTDGLNYLSIGVEKLYGLKHSDASKDVSLIWNQVVPDDIPNVTASLQESAANMTDWDCTFRIHDLDGNLKYVRTFGRPQIDENKRVTWDTIALDVTEQISLDQAVKEQQQQLENINNKIPGVVLQYFIDSEGKDGLNYLSGGVKKVYGIEQKDAFENVGLIWERILPEYIPDMAASIQKSAETMEDWDHVFEAIDVDGNKKHLRGLGTPHKDDNGKIIWDTLTLDITEQVVQEKEIKEKSIQLQNFTDQLPGVALRYYLKTDGSDGLLFLSKGVEEIYEVNRDEALANVSLMWNQIHPDDVEEMQRSVSESAENLSRWENVHRIVTPSGKTKYMSSVGIPKKEEDGTIVWDTISMDITKQRENEEAVRESQKVLDNLTNQVPGMVYVYQVLPDGSDRFIYQNKGIEDVFEIKPEDAYRDISLIWNCIHPDDVANLAASVQESAANLSQWNNLYRIITPSGITKHIQGSGSPIKLEDGTIQWFSMGVDISKEIEQKNRLSQQREQIENLTNSIQGVVLKYQVHPDGSDSIPYISGRVKEYWGVDAQTVTTDISKAWARVVPEDIEYTAKKVEESIANMSPWTQIMRFISETGEVKHMQGYGLPKLLPDGTVEYDTVMIDVTGQELAKQEAKEKQRELDLIGDQIPGVVFTYYRKPDGTDGFLNFSDGFEELHGFDRAKALENPRLLWDQAHSEDLPGFVSALMDSANTMTKLNYQYRITRPDGEVRYLQGFGSPTKKEDGTIVWNAINLDITDRKLAEEEIAEKSQQIQSITNQVPGVVLRYQFFPDGTDKILFISDGVEETYGVSKEAALEDSSLIWDRYLPEEVEALRSSIEESAKNLTPWEHVYRYYNQEGEIGYLQGFGTPNKMEDGSVIWDAITMDITKRMNAELEAYRSNKKLRSFINSSPIAIFQIEPGGTVTDFWNPASELTFGWTKDEVIGQNLPHIRDENRDEFTSIIEDIRITNKPKQYQVKRHNKYNEELTLEITAGPLFDESGKLTDLLIIANDITELEEYRKSLETTLREKEILLQEIHHRVKNNLAIVSGLLELQAMKDDNQYDISLIIEARNRIHSIAMVHEQLYQDMDFSHINPSEYYRKLLKKLQANTISDERDIEYDLKFDIEKININRAVPLGLLINELFTNSIKYAFKDGKGKLKLHFTQTGEQIRVHYEDDGPGFDLEEIKTKNTIGWQLIETLLVQLDSEFTMDTENRFLLDFEFTEAMQGAHSHYGSHIHS